MPILEESIIKFLDSYQGRELKSKYNLTHYDKWVVLGEDPNCDLGGNHIQPVLGYYEGRLIDVIKVAVKLPRFYSWGFGGDIKLAEIPNCEKV